MSFALDVTLGSLVATIDRNRAAGRITPVLAMWTLLATLRSSMAVTGETLAKQTYQHMYRRNLTMAPIERGIAELLDGSLGAEKEHERMRQAADMVITTYGPLLDALAIRRVREWTKGARP